MHNNNKLQCLNTKKITYTDYTVFTLLNKKYRYNYSSLRLHVTKYTFIEFVIPLKKQRLNPTTNLAFSRMKVRLDDVARLVCLPHSIPGMI